MKKREATFCRQRKIKAIRARPVFLKKDFISTSLGIGSLVRADPKVGGRASAEAPIEGARQSLGPTFLVYRNLLQIRRPPEPNLGRPARRAARRPPKFLYFRRIHFADLRDVPLPAPVSAWVCD